MRYGLWKNPKRQGHCLLEGGTLFNGALRILTLWGEFTVYGKRISQFNFQVSLILMLRFPSSCHQETLTKNIILPHVA